MSAPQVPVPHGFDISHANTITAPSLIPAYELMICKATEGKTFVDPHLTMHWSLFEQRKTKYRGLYHWIKGKTCDPVAEAHHFIDTVRKLPGFDAPGVFYILDWERDEDLTFAKPVQVDVWLNVVGGFLGPRSMVYSAAWVAGFINWRRTTGKDVPLWMAAYDLALAQAALDLYRADAWQFTDHYPVPGFAHPIDMNQIIDFGTLDRISHSVPVSEEHDMGIFYKADDGDNAIFLVSGGMAVHMKSRAAMSQQIVLGLAKNQPEAAIHRDLFKPWVLAGTVDYPAGWVGTRTKPTDFAANVL